MSKMSWWLVLACCLCLLPRMTWAATGWSEYRTENGCVLYVSYANQYPPTYQWSGTCEAGKPISGPGKLTQTSSGDCSIFTGEMFEGYWIGRVNMEKLGTSCQGAVLRKKDFEFPAPSEVVARYKTAKARPTAATEPRPTATESPAAGNTAVMLSAASRQKRSITASTVQLQPGEDLLRGADGCGRIWVGDPKFRKTVIDSAKSFTWDGACSDGLALGPGKLIQLGDKGQPVSISEMWMLHGRHIGRGTTVVYPMTHYAGSRNEIIEWNGESYSRSLDSRSPTEPQAGKEWLSAAHRPQDVTRRVSFTMLATCLDPEKYGKKKNYNGEPCIAEYRYPTAGDDQDGRVPHYCKPGKCVSLWEELVGPLVADFDEFERMHAAEIAAAKQSAELMLGPLTAEYQAQKTEAERLVAEEERRVAAETQRKAQIAAARQQEVTAANQARKPVSSPNLDALIKRVKESAK